MDFCIKCQTGFKPIYENLIIKYCKNTHNEEFSVYINSNESEICNDGYFLSFFNELKKYVETAQLKNVKNVLALKYLIFALVVLMNIIFLLMIKIDNIVKNVLKIVLNVLEQNLLIFAFLVKIGLYLKMENAKK